MDQDHIARITNPSNKQVYRVALGEQLHILCEGYGDGDNNNLLYWHDGQSVVTQYVGYCAELDINNSSCIPPLYEEYRASRVKSYRTRLYDCSTSARQKSLLDISIVNWTDSVSSYSCVSTKEGSTSQLNVTVYVIVGEYSGVTACHSGMLGDIQYTCMSTCMDLYYEHSNLHTCFLNVH